MPPFAEIMKCRTKIARAPGLSVVVSPVGPTEAMIPYTNAEQKVALGNWENKRANNAIMAVVNNENSASVLMHAEIFGVENCVADLVRTVPPTV